MIDYVYMRLTRKQAQRAAGAVRWYVGTLGQEDVLVPVWVQRGIFEAHHALLSAATMTERGHV